MALFERNSLQRHTPHSKAGSDSTASTNLEILPEDIRYKMKYGQHLNHADALSLAHHSTYSILAPYFALKMFDKQPGEQKEILSSIVESLSKSQKLGLTLKASFIGIRPEMFETVHPNKLSRVSLWSPSLIRDRANQVLSETVANEETPVIIGYSGFLALEAAVRHLFEGTSTLIVLPKKVNSSEPNGYKISRTADQITTEFLDEDAIAESKNVALIDDALKTGATAHTVSTLFPNAKVRNAPLFVT